MTSVSIDGERVYLDPSGRYTQDRTTGPERHPAKTGRLLSSEACTHRLGVDKGERW